MNKAIRILSFVLVLALGSALLNANTQARTTMTRVRCGPPSDCSRCWFDHRAIRPTRRLAEIAAAWAAEWAGPAGFGVKGPL